MAGTRIIGAPLGVTAAMAALAVVATSVAGAKVRDFSLGVAAGEVSPRSAKLWAHAEGVGRVRTTVALDRRFRRVVAAKRAKAKRSDDGTVQITFRRLRPDTGYWYRSCSGRKCSDRGRFRTAPKARNDERVRFAVSGDADATAKPPATDPFYGSFAAMRAMRRERNDFNVLVGDTIYSDSGVAGPPAVSVAEKWAKYRQALGVRNYSRLRAAASLYTHWDDHEFVNDFSRAEDGDEIYDAGVTAFTDYAPVSHSRRGGLYRTFRWGRNVELFFLDQRSFRSPPASIGGACDNPETGQPDLVPTAPPEKRATFALAIPSLAEPVSAVCVEAINDPSRTLLGERQLASFLADLEASDARWKVVVNETPIQQFYGLPYDRWEGYAHERLRLLGEMQRRAPRGVVFVSTDAHAAFANVVRERTFDDDVAPANASPAAGDTPYSDFVIGPVATATFWDKIDGATGTDGAGRFLSLGFFKPDPPDGVGMHCSQGGENSYAQITAGRRKLEVAYRTEKGERLTDVNGSGCGPYVLTR